MQKLHHATKYKLISSQMSASQTAHMVGPQHIGTTAQLEHEDSNWFEQQILNQKGLAAETFAGRQIGALSTQSCACLSVCYMHVRREEETGWRRRFYGNYLNISTWVFHWVDHHITTSTSFSTMYFSLAPPFRELNTRMSNLKKKTYAMTFKTKLHQEIVTFRKLFTKQYSGLAEQWTVHGVCNFNASVYCSF